MVSLETREIRNEKTIIIFTVTDFTDTIILKTFAKNEDVNNTGNVSGVLLYAKTNEEIVPNLSTEIGGNKFYVQTLDLNQDFNAIKAQLDSICNNYL